MRLEIVWFSSLSLQPNSVSVRAALCRLIKNNPSLNLIMLSRQKWEAEQTNNNNNKNEEWLRQGGQSGSRNEIFWAEFISTGLTGLRRLVQLCSAFVAILWKRMEVAGRLNTALCKHGCVAVWKFFNLGEWRSAVYHTKTFSWLINKLSFI